MRNERPQDHSRDRAALFSLQVCIRTGGLASWVSHSPSSQMLGGGAQSQGAARPWPVPAAPARPPAAPSATQCRRQVPRSPRVGNSLLGHRHLLHPAPDAETRVDVSHPGPVWPPGSTRQSRTSVQGFLGSRGCCCHTGHTPPALAGRVHTRRARSDSCLEGFLLQRCTQRRGEERGENVPGSARRTEKG